MTESWGEQLMDNGGWQITHVERGDSLDAWEMGWRVIKGWLEENKKWDRMFAEDQVVNRAISAWPAMSMADYLGLP